MLSRLITFTRPAIAVGPKFVIKTTQVNSNVISKRWSGHNTMEIEPSNYNWKLFKDTVHFWVLVIGVPITVFTTILGLRMNPVLSEVPEGYEPRHWEYYRHPIARFMAKYLFTSEELDDEELMSYFEVESENQMMEKMQKRVERVMRFYNDHRSLYYRPFYAEIFRIDRDDMTLGLPYAMSKTNEAFEDAHDPKFLSVPVEGFKPPSE